MLCNAGSEYNLFCFIAAGVTGIPWFSTLPARRASFYSNMVNYASQHNKLHWKPHAYPLKALSSNDAWTLHFHLKLSDSSCFSTSSTSSLERSNTGTNIFMGNYYPSSSYTSLAGETNVVGWGGVCTNMAFTSHCWDGWALDFRTLPCTPNAHDDETFHSAYVLLVINGWWGRSDFDRISLDRRAFFINVEANRPKGIRKGCRRVRFTCSFSESPRNFFFLPKARSFRKACEFKGSNTE